MASMPTDVLSRAEEARPPAIDAREFEPRESLERMLFESVLRRSGAGTGQLVQRSRCSKEKRPWHRTANRSSS
jgi:hypothetical protein